MSDLYLELTADASPLSLADAKAYMRISSSADDALIQSMIDACTEYGENYTGRSFRNKTFKLLTDCLLDRIVINRSPVDSITSVKYLLDNVLTAVDASVYYLKKGVLSSEILLHFDKEWPNDVDAREQAIEIEFSVIAYHAQALIAEALKHCVSFMYFNRGDCCTCEQASSGSGADRIYGQFRIQRINCG